MVYKILYIEDQNPDTIIARLHDSGDFKVKHLSPNTLENVLENLSKQNLLLLDFKLTEEADIQVDAPTIASALRTFGSDSHKNIPIVLISTRENITNYYKDFTSKDLFDLTTTKDNFLDNIEKYTKRLKSLISAYKLIGKEKGKMEKILGISTKFKKSIDYRIELNLKKETIKDDIFAYSNFIHQNLIRSIGVLIGEDVLSARLGISKDSPDWEKLKVKLGKAKYKGISSDSYNRWWAQKIIEWFEKNNKGKSSLRRLNAQQRCEVIKKITKLKRLIPLEKIDDRGYKAQSSNFWTFCKETKKAIDPIDGFEIYDRELFGWQEKEYISFLGKSSVFEKFLKPSDKERIREIEKSLKS